VSTLVRRRGAPPRCAPVSILVGAALAVVGAAPATAAQAPATAPPATDGAAEQAAALVTLEGTVAELREAEGEGGLSLRGFVLATGRDEDGGAAVEQILLAPDGALAEAGFEVEVGDRVRVRVFVTAGSRTAYAQKALNRTRGRMVRLRTLRQEPLWDAAGRWQGAETAVGPADGERRRAGQRPPTRPPRRRPAGPSRPPPAPRPR
jgi:hypothetical protein